MRKKLFILLLALVGLTGTMRAVNYDLLVCGTQVTSDNAADLSVIDGVTGTVSFDASSNTLTLENATISCSTTHAIQTASMNGVTISVVGTNTVTTTYRYGLNMQGTGLTISGSGSLSILSPRASIRFNGTLAISGGVQLTAEATSVGNYACPIYAVGSSESSVVVSGAGTVVRLKGRDWPMHNVSSLSLNDGLQITTPEGAYLADDKYIRVGTTMVEDEWVVIMNPAEAEMTAQAENVLNPTRYDVDGNGDVTLSDLTLLANALVGRVNYPITRLVLSHSLITPTTGALVNLIPTLTPATPDYPTLLWTSSNRRIATVSADGSVRAVGTGTCTVTASTLDGSNLSASCTVTVTEPAGGSRDYVDLGLPSGTLWAKCNIGATEAEEYGYYFRWGMTEPQYTEIVPYFDSGYSIYNTSGGLTELKPEHDAAYVQWGSDWRMPSKDQFNELIDSRYTTCTRTTYNNVYGLLIVSKVEGYVGNSIFLPAGGYGYNTATSYYFSSDGDFGGYYTRTLYSDSKGYALNYMKSYQQSCSGRDRWQAMSIRPVRNQ